MLDITEKKEKSVLEIEFSGEPDMDDLYLFEDHLKKVIYRHEKFISLNFSGMRSIPLYFSIPLLKFKNDVQVREGRVFVRDAPETFRFFLMIANLEEGFEFRFSSDV
ncbi:MAG: hypothetical protein GC154_00475 [bacterium]|nr:hypothetical protein [bacterium]